MVGLSGGSDIDGLADGPSLGGFFDDSGDDVEDLGVVEDSNNADDAVMLVDAAVDGFRLREKDGYADK